MTDDSDDPRDAELLTLAAIYPEIRRIHPDDPYGVALEVPVNPPKPVNVFFCAGTGGVTSQNPNEAPSDATSGSNQPGAVDSHEIAFLPPVRLEITLGSGYPTEQPPKVKVSTSTPWIPIETIKRLEDDASRLWEDLGRSIVGFTYIDHVQQAATDVFGLVDERGSLELDSRCQPAILSHDIIARKVAFDNTTFECGVCLEPKKGSVCHRMLDCGHVFCVDCLQGFYNTAIKEGDISAVICPEPNCAKDRAKTASPGSKHKRVRTFIHPSELLQIPLDQDMVRRYLMLRYKLELESDRRTVYCPRKWCNGAARSKKHKKPQGLELPEVSDDDSASEGEEKDEEEGESDEDSLDGEGKPKRRERLAICEECGFAFCARCLQSWHGEQNICPGSREARLAAAELASLEYIRLHTTPCPKCEMPAQKTQGCNHMLCSRCGTHFCYLCSTRLDPDNPYRHYNTPPNALNSQPCYMRLWELMEGDGADAPGFERVAGRQRAQPARAAPAMAHARGANAERGRPPEAANVHGNGGATAPAQGPEVNDVGQTAVGVAREGPLVLRIAADPPPAASGRGGPDRGQPPAVRRGVPGGAGLREPGTARNQPAARGRGQVRRQQLRQAARGAGPNAGGGVAAQRGRQRHDMANAWDVGWDGGLDPAQEEWVRQFVLLALNDEEHLLFGDDDD